MLDASLRVGRWTHKRGWDLADKFIHRMVVANSAILHARARRTNPKLDADCGIGLCIDGTEPRRFHIASVTLSDPSPMHQVVAWTPGSWEETDVRTKSPAAVTA